MPDVGSGRDDSQNARHDTGTSPRTDVESHSTGHPARNDTRVRYFIVNNTPAEEAAYMSRIFELRNVEKPSGVIASVAQLVKGALGAGILSSHVAFAAAGLIPGLILGACMGLFMLYNLYLIGACARTCYRRCGVPSLSYPDVAEASFAIHPNKCIQRLSRYVRYWIDLCICLELYGACACYQLMVAFTIKQLVEDDPESAVPGKNGYPSVRIYLLALMIPFVCICLIRHLQWLAPASMAGNVFVSICVITTIYYSFKENPKFEGLPMTNTVMGCFTFMGMMVFSMSCVGVVLPVENNLKDPTKYAKTLLTGVSILIIFILTTAFFGFNAYKENSKAPITLNFPLETFPKILKVIIALNIYTTHGINFWVPFNLTYVYIQKCVRPGRRIMMEYVLRALFSIAITLLAILFPDVVKVVSFLGCFCLSNTGLLFPTIMNLLLCWEKPGLGFCKWRLFRALFCIILSLILFVFGSANSIADLITLFRPAEKAEKLYVSFDYSMDQEL